MTPQEQWEHFQQIHKEPTIKLAKDFLLGNLNIGNNEDDEFIKLYTAMPLKHHNPGRGKSMLKLLKKLRKNNIKPVN